MEGGIFIKDFLSKLGFLGEERDSEIVGVLSLDFLDILEWRVKRSRFTAELVTCLTSSHVMVTSPLRHWRTLF